MNELMFYAFALAAISMAAGYLIAWEIQQVRLRRWRREYYRSWNVRPNQRHDQT